MTTPRGLAISALLVLTFISLELHAVQNACEQIFINNDVNFENPVAIESAHQVSDDLLFSEISESVVQSSRLSTHLIGKMVYVHVKLQNGDEGFLRGEVLGDSQFSGGTYALVIRDNRHGQVIRLNFAGVAHPAVYLVPTSVHTLLELSPEERQGENLDEILTPAKFEELDNVAITHLRARVRLARSHGMRDRRSDHVIAELRAMHLERKLLHSEVPANYQAAKDIIRIIYPRVWNAVIQIRVHQAAINSSFEKDGSAFISGHAEKLQEAKDQLLEYGADFLTTDIHLARRFGANGTPAVFNTSLQRILSEVLEEFPGDNNVVPTRDEIIYYLTTDADMVVDRLERELRAERRSGWQTAFENIWSNLGLPHSPDRHDIFNPF